MNWSDVCLSLVRIVGWGINVLNPSYNMIVNNKLLLCFILMCCIFIGIGLIKRLFRL